MIYLRRSLDLRRAIGLASLAVLATATGPSASAATFTTSAAAVSITEPAPGAIVRGGSVALAASTDILLASVQFQRAAAGSGAWVDVGAADALLPYTASWDTRGVPDGAYEVRAVGADLLGAKTISSPVPVTVDNTAPVVSVTAPGDASIRGVVDFTSDATDATSGVASVAFERSPAGAGAWTVVGTDSTAPFGVSLNTSALADGSYDLRAIASDRAGNARTSAVRTVRVDNSPPSGTVGGASDETLTGTATVTASALDGGSGVSAVRFEHSPLDENQWVEIGTDLTSPYEVPFATALLADGVYEIRAVVVDLAGNVTVTASRRVRLDNTLHAPTLSFFDFTNAFVSDGVVYFRPGVAGGFSVVAEADQFADPAHLEFPLLGTGWSGGGTDALPPYEAVYTFDATASPLAGEHGVTIVETSGVRSSASTFTLAADATPPTTTFACDSAACRPWYRAPVTVSLHPRDTGAGVARTRYSTDGSDPAAGGSVYGGPFVVSTTSTVTAASVDALGNAETPATLIVGVDATAPAAALSAPPAGAVLTGDIASVTATASDAGSGVASVTFEQRRAGTTAFAPITTDSTAPYETAWSLTGIANGEYELRAVAVDAAGNTFATDPVAVSVSRSASVTTQSISLATGTARVSTTARTATIVLPVTTNGSGSVTVTLLKGKRRIFTWRSRVREGTTRLRLALPRRLLRPGTYVVAVTVRAPDGTVTRRVGVRATRR